jgi:hypothetical protein
MSTTPIHKKAHFAPSVKKDAKLFLICFDFIRQQQHYWHKWILDTGWIDIIDDHFDIPSNLKFVSSNLNRAIGRSAIVNGIDSVSESNVNGLYKATYFERVGKKSLD